jgi:ketosteroid isomerase-like protein
MENHTEFVQALYAAFGRGDVADILDACDPAITWSSNCDPAVVPWGGDRQGKDGVTAFFTALGKNLDFEVFEPRQFLPSGNTVVVLGRTRARFKTGGHGVFDSDWVEVFTLRDGKLTAFHEYYDTAAIERAKAV